MCQRRKKKCQFRCQKFKACCQAIQRRQWHPTPALLPGKSHGWRSLVGCSPWGRYESDMTETTQQHQKLGHQLQVCYFQVPFLTAERVQGWPEMIKLVQRRCSRGFISIKHHLWLSILVPFTLLPEDRTIRAQIPSTGSNIFDSDNHPWAKYLNFIGILSSIHNMPTCIPTYWIVVRNICNYTNSKEQSNAYSKCSFM